MARTFWIWSILLICACAVPATADRKGSKSKVQNKVQHVSKVIPDLGALRGRVIRTAWSKRKVAQFLDIPYGKSTSGPLRFKPAVAIEPWTGVLKAFEPHFGCPTIGNLAKIKSFGNKKANVESCLRLTVTSPTLTGSAPVMVYIHGNFLYDGQANEAVPTYLLEQDVVLVAVRYRLGPFGFLSTMTPEIPGNAAIHDIILALEWIQKHIAAFGGDPERVTLFGQAGGAALINVLTLSTAVRENLFHRVIYQSASAMTPFFTTDNPLPAAKDIAKSAGCKNLNKVEAVNKCLRTLNTSALLEAFNMHMETRSDMGVGYFGGAQITIGGPSNIIPDHPGKILLTDNYKAYPAMGGTTKNVGSFLLRDIYLHNFNESIVDDLYNGTEYVQYIVQQTNGPDPTGAWTKFAKTDLFAGKNLDNHTFYDVVSGLIDLSSTIAFKNPLLLALQSNAKKMPNDTYLYSFDYMGENNRFTENDNDATAMPFEMGVTLSDENLYLFPWPAANMLSNVRDMKMAKRIVNLWTSFAATGVPEAPNTPKWPPMTEDTGPYIKIGQTITIAESYIDEFNVTVCEAAMGLNLVNDDFFGNLEDVDSGSEEGTDKSDSSEEDENDHLVLDFQEERGGNLIFIATNKRL